MDEAMAASPLPTRQLKRMAAKSLARELSKTQKLAGRIAQIQQRKLERKRRRAEKAAAQHAGT